MPGKKIVDSDNAYRYVNAKMLYFVDSTLHITCKNLKHSLR